MFDQSDCFSALDSRYRNKIDGILDPYLSQKNYLEYLLQIELAIVEVLANYEINGCDEEVVKAVKEACKKVTPEEVKQEEDRIQHDILAVVHTIQKNLDPKNRNYVHMFATSYDVIDTANAKRVKDSILKVIDPKLDSLAEVFSESSQKYKTTKMIGRTHFQYAIPITFGYLLSTYIERLDTCMEKIGDAASALAGKFSGPVGNHNGMVLAGVEHPVHLEHSLMHKLGLNYSYRSTQIVPRDNMYRLLFEIHVCSEVFNDFATDIRLLQGSDIAEVFEPFDKSKQKGSSSMPHKRNPIICERICSISEIIFGLLNSQRSTLNSWLQRDLTNSLVGRTYGEAIFWFCYQIQLMTDLVRGLEVDEERMKKNLKEAESVYLAAPILDFLKATDYPDPHEKIRNLIFNNPYNRSLGEAVVQDSEIINYFATDDGVSGKYQELVDLIEMATGCVGTCELQVG